jgi:ribosomal protein S18 acetylase RimI-like enzyme
MPETGRPVRITELLDERSADAAAALALIERTFAPRDRHAPQELRSELEEKRLELVPRNRPHLFGALVDGVVVGSIYGAYMAGPNCGFVAYVAVDPDHRGGGIARQLRAELAERFRGNARAVGHDELGWVVGEVRRSSPWLTELVRRRGAIPLDLEYFHPGMSPGDGREPYSLYLEPVGDIRRELPVLLVQRIIFAVYRVAYRVRHPLTRPGFRAMIEELDGRAVVGPHREVVERAATVSDRPGLATHPDHGTST